MSPSISVFTTETCKPDRPDGDPTFLFPNLPPTMRGNEESRSGYDVFRAEALAASGRRLLGEGVPSDERFGVRMLMFGAALVASILLLLLFGTHQAKYVAVAELSDTQASAQLHVPAAIAARMYFGQQVVVEFSDQRAPGAITTIRCVNTRRTQDDPEMCLVEASVQVVSATSSHPGLVTATVYWPSRTYAAILLAHPTKSVVRR